MKATAAVFVATLAASPPADTPQGDGPAPATLTVAHPKGGDAHEPARNNASAVGHHAVTGGAHPKNAQWKQCKASWYRPKPKHVSQWGTRLLTAHRTLRPGTKLEVTHGGKAVTVTVCGYGPARWTGRDLDLTRTAFRRLALPSRGVVNVRWRVAK